MRKKMNISFRCLSSNTAGDGEGQGEALVNTAELTMTLSFKMEGESHFYLLKGKANGIGAFEGRTAEFSAMWRQLDDTRYTGLWRESGDDYIFMLEVEE